MRNFHFTYMLFTGRVVVCDSPALLGIGRFRSGWYRLQWGEATTQALVVKAMPCTPLKNGMPTRLILGLCPANERGRYFVTTSLICWAQAKNQSYTREWNPNNSPDQYVFVIELLQSSTKPSNIFTQFSSSINEWASDELYISVRIEYVMLDPLS